MATAYNLLVPQPASPCLLFALSLVGAALCPLFLLLPLVSLGFQVTRHTGREMGFFPVSDLAVPKWEMSTLLTGVAALRKRRRRSETHSRTRRVHLLACTGLQPHRPPPSHTSPAPAPLSARASVVSAPGLGWLWRNPVLQSNAHIPEAQEKFLCPPGRGDIFGWVLVWIKPWAGTASKGRFMCNSGQTVS